jgi:hypothetical protein
MSLENKYKHNDSKLTPVNRTNASNIPAGQYNVKKTNNQNGFYPPSNPLLTDLENKAIVQTLNQWDGKKNYLSQFIGAPKIKLRKNRKPKSTIPPQTQVDNIVNKAASGDIPSNFSSEQLKDNLQFPK